MSWLTEDQRSQTAFLPQDFHHLFLSMQYGLHQDIAATFSRFFDFAGLAAPRKSSPSHESVVCTTGLTGLKLREKRTDE